PSTRCSRSTCPPGSLPRLPVVATTLPQAACFLAFWGLNLLIIWRGIDSVRILLNIKAPLLIALGLALLAWAYHAAGGFGLILSQPSQFDPGGAKAGQFRDRSAPASAQWPGRCAAASQPSGSAAAPDNPDVGPCPGPARGSGACRRWPPPG